MPVAKEPPQDTDDDVLKSILLLKEDMKSAHGAFSKKLGAGTLTLELLSAEVGELFSMQADLAALTFQAHHEQFDWAGEVDDDIDQLKASLGDGTTILPEDAARLKATILSLVQNLRAATDSADSDVLTQLKARADEAVAFIDESTAEDDPDEPDDETEQS